MSFVSELRRRNVVRVAIFYAVASWLIQQPAGEALQLEQVDGVLFVHTGSLAGRVVPRQRAFLPNSLRNSMPSGPPVTVDVFPAHPRG